MRKTMDRTMPTPLINAAGLIALIYCAVVDLAAATILAVGSSSVMGDTKLRAWCIIGSVAGGAMAVCIWMPKNETPETTFRRLLIKFFGSTLLGATFGPFAIRYWELPRDEDFVMGVAAAIAFLGVWLIHLTAPVIEAAWPAICRWFATKFFGAKP